MPIEPLGVGVRARIVGTKGHVQAVDNPLDTSRAAGLNVAGTERPSVFVEMPPLIAEQTTRLAVWMSTAKQSFLLKIKKHGATNLLHSS
jgi:hypothetical protein